LSLTTKSQTRTIGLVSYCINQFARWPPNSLMSYSAFRTQLRCRSKPSEESCASPMIVKMKVRGSCVSSLRIGARNVRRYFTKSVPAVDLDLDGLQIQCDLSQNSWRNEPEIVDPRLCAWLTAKKTKLRVDGDSAVLLMVPAGRNSFRLQAKQIREAATSGRSLNPALRFDQP